MRGPKPKLKRFQSTRRPTRRWEKATLTRRRTYIFFEKASELSYVTVKSDCLQATVMVTNEERDIRGGLAALEAACFGALQSDFKLHLPSTGIISSLPTTPVPPECNDCYKTVIPTFAFPLIFDYISLSQVMSLTTVCKTWYSHLGQHGVHYVLFFLRSYVEKHGKIPIRFTEQCLRSVTVGVRWNEDGKELGATVRVTPNVSSKTGPEGSDISGGSSSVAKYYEKEGRIEDIDSDDLEVVFADGARKWIGAHSLSGTRRERWIVRIAPGPYWAEIWIVGGQIHLQTILQEEEPPSATGMPWIISPIWPVKRSRTDCEKVALHEKGFYLKLRGVEQLVHQVYRGMSDYEVVRGKRLLPDILLGRLQKEQVS
eukprot:TRINITY_DN3721_c0_g1_i4.p1 TRINITY_DN3721_c0_g1~~TRINITY_DN3721_c0_g1_i4.p1  ORF type:complete len:371 (+),score=61.65 TRINITY_DN3721_c0_g1_i4:541-1653(+)